MNFPKQKTARRTKQALSMLIVNKLRGGLKAGAIDFTLGQSELRCSVSLFTIGTMN
jgi:hypothetical protein